MRERDRKRGTLPSPDMTAAVHYRNKQAATVSLIVAFFLVLRAAANFLLTSCHAVQHSAPLLVDTVASDDSSHCICQLVGLFLSFSLNCLSCLFNIISN